ncbi:MAG: hypothetical protein P1V20_13615 [Verrucomicrobiales bacterium]|nr:hypothetical protein [Verrucomicrobiales bacterium]
MKNIKKTSVTLTAAAVLGISLVAADSNAQGWRSGNHNSYGYNNSRTASHGWESRNQRNSLQSDVVTIDRIAQQMTVQFAREMRYTRRSRESVALFNHLQTYSRTTQNLVRASRGSCPITFKKAANNVRETLTCVEGQAKRVRNLSCTINDSLEQSCSLATRIQQNAHRFNPVSVTTRTVPHGNHARQVPVANNRNVRVVSHNPFLSLLSELIR